MRPTHRRTSSRTTPRATRPIALLATVAASALSFPDLAQGQTWLNPNNGSWSVGANWIGGFPPASSALTQLTFNATGAQSYSSNNNIAAPFTLNRITFNNTSTGLITITGQSLAFGGANPGIVYNGTGPVTMNNVITLPTTAGTIDTTTISGAGSGTFRFNGAINSSVAPSFTNGAILRNDNANASVNLFGGGNLHGLFANVGSINVTNGTQTSIVATAGFDVGNVGSLSAIGATAQITTRELNAGFADNSTGHLTASGGGKFLVNNGNAFLASASNIAGDFLGSNATTTVTGTGSAMTITGNGFIDATGILMFAQGAIGSASAGTMNISAGGQVSTVAAFMGERDGVATVNISGSGSQFNNSDQFVLQSTNASRMTLSAGGRWTSTGPIYTSSNPTDNSVISVSGANSLADWSGAAFAVFSGGLGIPGGNTTALVSGGGEIRANLIFAAENQDAQANITVDGTNSRLTLVGNVGVGGGDGFTDNTLVMSDDIGTSSSLTVINGGRVTIGTNGALIMTRANPANATAVFSGNGSQLDASAAGAQLLIGGTGTTATGTAAFNLSSNASANVNSLTVVYTRGWLNIGAGAVPASFTSGATSVDGVVNFNSGTLVTSGTLSVAGNVNLSSAARNAAGTPTNKKVLEAGTLSMTASGVIDLNDNDAIFRSTPLATVQARIAAGRNGGLWNAPGITSTAAKNANPRNTSLGAITGTDFKAAQGVAATFNGRAVANTDVLVKYTFYGDTDLNGVVNFDDYARTDNGFNNGRSGWFNGDFDYSGTVNFDDYSLLDLAFNTQGATILSAGNGALAGPGDRQIIGVDLTGVAVADVDRPDLMRRLNATSGTGGAGLNVVPEPASLGVCVIGLTALAARRRRRAVH